MGYQSSGHDGSRIYSKFTSRKGSAKTIGRRIVRARGKADFVRQRQTRDTSEGVTHDPD